MHTPMMHSLRGVYAKCAGENVSQLYAITYHSKYEKQNRTN
jgi:hypothetical protein